MYTLVCDECGAVLNEYFPIEQLDLLAIRAGWDVRVKWEEGKQRGHHTCPECMAKKKAEESGAHG